MITKEESKNIIFYGNSQDVNSVRYWDYNDYLNLSSKNQKMEGFDSEYRDFVDYILKITHRIWEEKGIGIIYDTYHNNVAMHFGSFNSYGIKSVISGTLQTLFSFPDRKLIGQNVIWSKHKETGFMSSHRILSTATNLNDSSFGPSTGKKVSFRTTVDCAVENNRIYEEWLVRDNLWIVKQLGLDPIEVAGKMAETSTNKLNDGVNTSTYNENIQGQLRPILYQAKDNQPGEIILEMLSRVYNYRLFNEVSKYYTNEAVVHYICDQDMVGMQQIQGMLVGLFAAFPNGAFSVDRVTYNDREEENSFDIAVRWNLKGLHEGLGIYGPATGKMVEILGISHYIMQDGKIIEEWLTYDGLDVYKQIYSGAKASLSDIALAEEKIDEMIDVKEN